MTTNQTIDGVPGLRELLERLYAEHVSIAGPGFWVAWKELRALLEKEVSGDSRAPQPQSEPVYMVRSHGSCCWEEMQGESLEMCQSQPGEYEVRKLYAEQPAPVAVVLPEQCRQRIASEGKPYPRSSCAVCGQFSPKSRECDVLIEATRLNAKE